MQTLKGQFFFQDKAPLVWTRPAKEKTVIQDITNVYIGTSLWVKMLQVKSVFRFDRIFFVFLFEFNNGQKCLGHICSLGALFKSHMPKNKVGRVQCIQNFSRVSSLYRVGEGELQYIFKKVPLPHQSTQKLQKIVNTAFLSQGRQVDFQFNLKNYFIYSRNTVHRVRALNKYTVSPTR